MNYARGITETITLWMTKYAITTGITRADGCEIDADGYVRRGCYMSSDYVFAYLGRTAFRTEAEARANAVKQARAKLKSIEKQMAKIEGLIREWETEDGNSS